MDSPGDGIDTIICENACSWADCCSPKFAVDGRLTALLDGGASVSAGGDLIGDEIGARAAETGDGSCDSGRTRPAG